MYIVDQKEKEFRFGDHGPKYLMRGPRSSFALVQFLPGQDFQAHYHKVMEENFYILEGTATIAVDGTAHDLTAGQMIHIEPNEVHYVMNRGKIPMLMVSTLAPHADNDKYEAENPKI